MSQLRQCTHAHTVCLFFSFYQVKITTANFKICAYATALTTRCGSRRCISAPFTWHFGSTPGEKYWKESEALLCAVGRKLELFLS